MTTADVALAYDLFEILVTCQVMGVMRPCRAFFVSYLFHGYLRVVP